jgi:hypothetical protein
MDPNELDEETDWALEGSWGYNVGADHKLGKCIPVMCNQDTGEVMFTAGGNFYEWNQLNLSLRQLLYPKALEDIITVMKEQGPHGLKWKSLS